MSGQVRSGQVGSGRSGRVGSGRVGRVGSGRVGLGWVGLNWVELGWVRLGCLLNEYFFFTRIPWRFKDLLIGLPCRASRVWKKLGVDGYGWRIDTRTMGWLLYSTHTWQSGWNGGSIPRSNRITGSVQQTRVLYYAEELQVYHCREWNWSSI